MQPPDLWTRGCLHQGILPPQETCIGPYDCLSIAAANLLPKGKARLFSYQPLGASPIPPVLGSNPVETSLHPPPFTGAPRDQGAKKNLHATYDSPVPPTRAARPPPSAQRAPTSRSFPLLLLISKRYFLRRTITAKRAHSVRIRASKRQPQSMLTDHWPELRPVSLPIYHRTKTPPPLLQRSLPSLGRKRDPSHKIRLDPPPPQRGPIFLSALPAGFSTPATFRPFPAGPCQSHVYLTQDKCRWDPSSL